jgi:hypothetical protein
VPAPARYPTPPAQVSACLIACRAAGMGFEEAWDAAVRGRADLGVPPLRWPHDTEVRQAWRRALKQTIPEWRACYEGEETPTGNLFRLLPTDAFDREGGDLHIDGEPLMQVA